MARPLAAPGQPVRSSTQRIWLSVAESQLILMGCRSLNVTFGNALPVLSQLAMSRVLNRLRHKGQISNQDWEDRLREPMHFTGPINYRPYLDNSWYKTGGVDEVMIAISFSALTLPSMPTSSVLDSTGAPPFSALFSPARFLARAQLAKARWQTLLKHPLLHEFHVNRLPARNERTRANAIAWRAAQNGKEPPKLTELPKMAGQFSNIAPCVFTNGGASLGNVRLILPHSSSLNKVLTSFIAGPPYSAQVPAALAARSTCIRTTYASPSPPSYTRLALSSG